MRKRRYVGWRNLAVGMTYHPCVPLAQCLPAAAVRALWGYLAIFRLQNTAPLSQRELSRGLREHLRKLCFGKGANRLDSEADAS
jgi:hypothetical protein